jgi:GntR family transcriptional regulator
MIRSREFSISIDRDSAVAISLQIRGQIELAITCGSLPTGTQLPSVRELAAELGVSPVTISQVYRQLQNSGLVTSQAGKGTFVVNNPGASANGPQHQIDSLIDQLADAAKAAGMDHNQLLQRVSSHLGFYHRQSIQLSTAVVGMFGEATWGYVESLRAAAQRFSSFEALTFSELEMMSASQVRSLLARYNLLVTFPYQVSALRKLAGPDLPITQLRFIPSQATRLQLANLNPDARVLAVATFPDYLLSLRTSVETFAPQLRHRVQYLVYGDPGLEAALGGCTALIYATGSERVTQLLRPGLLAFEHRYVPDPDSIQEELLPILRLLRAGWPVALRQEEQ